MLRNSVLQNDKSRKFHLPYCGPYCFVEVLPPVNYVIESLDGSTTKRVYFNRLKKSGCRINEKSTVEDEKLKESSRPPSGGFSVLCANYAEKACCMRTRKTAEDS